LIELSQLRMVVHLKVNTPQSWRLSH